MREWLFHGAQRGRAPLTESIRDSDSAGEATRLFGIQKSKEVSMLMDGDKRVMMRVRTLLCEIEAEQKGMALEDIKRLRGIKMSRWLTRTVHELLSGYHERERYTRQGNGSPEVIAEYKRINRAIDDAIGVACFGYAADVAAALHEDMIAGRGWNKSVVSGVFSERTFYKVKRQCYLYVAAKLGLI